MQRFRRCLGLFFLLASACSAELVSYQPPDFSVPGEPTTASRTVVYARDGSVLEVIAAENRRPVRLDRVPLLTQYAFLAAEDHRFYEHRGIDGFAVARAVRENRKAGRIVEGASTITEQYVKNLYFAGEPRTAALKLREAAIALGFERGMSKQEIFESYLNTIYLGAGAYGIQAAAETYFNRDAEKLTLPQGALVAGLARSPEGANPFYYPEFALERRGTVLEQMVEHHLLGRELADWAKAQPLGLEPGPDPGRRFPYFSDYVRQAFLDDGRFGAAPEDRAWFLFRGGLEIRTTIDPVLQAKAEAASVELLYDETDPEVAIATVDPSTGEVLAMVGGRDYAKRRFNLATQAQRQAGSAFKTFALVAAIERGLDPDYTVLDSTPRVFQLSTGELWPVNNFDGRGYGQITLTDATIHSVNAAFAELTLRIGGDAVVNQSRNMGIETENLPVPSVVLGGLSTGVNPLEMASAYGTLANGGIALRATPIASVTYPDGQVIDGHHEARRGVSPGGAFVATQVLERALRTGTGRRADIERPAAGKTGTTSDFTDAWFVGYTPQLSTSVWVGYPDGSISMYGIGGVNVAGGTYPADIWGSYMWSAHGGLPSQDFRKPVEDFQKVSIVPGTRVRAGQWCAGVTVELANVLVPRQVCPRPRPQPAAPMTPTITALTPTVEVTPGVAPPTTAPPLETVTLPTVPGDTTTPA